MISRIDRLAALLAVFALMLALPIITYPLGRDQGMYANIAQAIREGGLPFIDMWDIKPPAIYYVYAVQISLLGAVPVALRAIDVFAAPFTMFALYSLTRAAFNRDAARWSMLLFPVFYFTETFASLTQSDSLVILPMTWAVLSAFRAGHSRGGSRRALGWSFACGVLCALVIWFKHYYVLFAVALAAAHLWQRQRASSQTSAARRHPLLFEIAAFVAGGLVIGLPSLIYFASSGILAEMLIVAQGTQQYNAQAFTSLDAFWTQMSNYVNFRWWHWGPLLLLVLSLPISNRLLERTEGTVLSAHSVAGEHGTKPWALIFLWLVAGLTFVIVQAKGFDTHWLPLLPPLVILAAGALAAWVRLVDISVASRLFSPLTSAGKRHALTWLVAAVTLVFFGAILAKDTWLRAWPYITGQQSQRVYYRQFQAGDLNAADSLRAARWLEERTSPGDSVYIWGFRPEVAFMAGLRPATRFQAQFALVGDRYPQAWKQENVDTLWAALPEYVLVMRADYMPWVTGSDKDSNTILADEYQALRDWLIYNYDRHTELGNFLIWKRKGDT